MSNSWTRHTLIEKFITQNYRSKYNPEHGCTGYHPRDGRKRYASIYKKLELSHGIVCHNKQEWTQIGRIQIHKNGQSEWFDIKKGTEVADGTWAELKQSIPKGCNSQHHDLIADYVYAWAWSARRHGEDLFFAMGQAIKEESCNWEALTYVNLQVFDEDQERRQLKDICNSF